MNICVKSWFIGLAIGILLGGFLIDSIHQKRMIEIYDNEIKSLKTSIYNMKVERENLIKDLLCDDMEEGEQ